MIEGLMIAHRIQIVNPCPQSTILFPGDMIYP
jgi:hypothetical protein